MSNVKERLTGILQSHQEVLNNIVESEIDTLIDILVEAYEKNRRIFVIAIGRSNLIMKAFAMRLMQVGYQSYVVFETNTPSFGTDDILIVGSGSGNTAVTNVVTKKALDFGATVIILSKNKDSDLSKAANLTVQIPTQVSDKKFQTKGGEFEQALFILLDAICVEVILKLKLINEVSEIDALISKLHANLQ